MITSILQSLFFIFFPAVIIWGTKHSKVLNWLSPVVLCYITGMILANVKFVQFDKTSSEYLLFISLVLALPLLLFSTDFIKWLSYSKKTIFSFLFCIVGVLISSITASFIFTNDLDLAENREISGMLIGVYTGGTPNMSAIGLALHKKEIIPLLNTTDILLSSVYFIFLMLLAQRLLLKFLPAYKPVNSENLDDIKDTGIASTESFKESKWFEKLKKVSFSIFLSLIIFGIAYGLAFFLKSMGIHYEEVYEEVTQTVNKQESTIVVILTVTTLGIAASFMKKIRNLKGTFESGEYLMFIFCITVASLANFNDVFKAGTFLLSYVAFVMVGALLIHFSLAAIFRIDADTVIITSTAGIFGAPFIAPIANILKNREILVAGLTTSLIGYALGNYLGIAVHDLLKYFQN
ncbi:MAG: DUF819 family protein [Bacteroidetes bacterium]|nr:DUF819 family protein [Bacteroidota bacterium]